jgi:lipoyl(octanoyl) transferase
MTHTPDHWRLIIDPGHAGPTNMAIDEAILETVGAENSPPTLRLYSWQPACFSLGQAQSAADADLDRLRERGWDIVRRMTGGRAILHVDEMTYSVALPKTHPLMAGSIIDSYCRLSSALLTALEQLGLNAHADERYETAQKTQAGPVCFEVPSTYEITANGKKLIGSAQVRRYSGALQHGSLPLHGDISRICDALMFESEESRQQARERVSARATTLADALGTTITWEQTAAALESAFASTFGIILDQGKLTEEEEQRTEYFLMTRYAAEVWTKRL